METRKRKKKVREQERRTQEIGYFNPSLEKFFVYGQPVPSLLRPLDQLATSYFPPPHILQVLKGEGIDSCSVLFTITTIAEYKSTEATRRGRKEEEDKFLPNATSLVRFNCGVREFVDAIFLRVIEICKNFCI